MSEETPTNKPENDQIVTENLVSEQITADNSVKEKSTPENDQNVTEDLVSEPVTTDNSVKEKSMPENLVSEQITTDNSVKEKSTPEIVANPEFIHWKYPPYCELCNVCFTAESCSKLHFDGKNHKNRLNTWRKYQNPEEIKDSKDVLCNICYKTMNTQAILDKHRDSPAHKKEENGRLIIEKLKEEYRQLKALQQE